MRFLSILFVLAFPLLLISVNASLAINQVGLYEYGFDRYGASARTGIERSELVKAARGLIHYFNSGDTAAEITVKRQGTEIQLFNQREMDHLRDVKSLIRLVYLLGLGTLLYTGIYLALGFRAWERRFWGELRKATMAGSVLTLAAIGSLGLAAIFSFDSLFLQFHLFSFSNMLWQLDPARDYLIMMFPEGFFRDATLFIALGVAGEALLLGAFSGWGELRARRQQKTSTIKGSAAEA